LCEITDLGSSEIKSYAREKRTNWYFSAMSIVPLVRCAKEYWGPRSANGFSTQRTRRQGKGLLPVPGPSWGSPSWPTGKTAPLSKKPLPHKESEEYQMVSQEWQVRRDYGDKARGRGGKSRDPSVPNTELQGEEKCLNKVKNAGQERGGEDTDKQTSSLEAV